MSTFRRCTVKLSSFSNITTSIRPCSSVPSTKHYRNLSNKEKRLVKEFIANAPASDVSMANLMTGKGLDPTMTANHKNMIKNMLSVLLWQFPNRWHKLRFMGRYLKNHYANKRKMAESKSKLNADLKGDAVEYDLVKNSLQGIILTKTLIDMYGNERASEMLSKAQESTGPMMNQILVNYLEKKVPHHLRFAVVNGINRNVIKKSEDDDGIFDIDWVDDDIYSKDFQFNVKRCVFRDMGREFGDTDDGGENNLTYTWFCQFDDKMIPNLGNYAEFEFQRSGTLGKGCTHCDFKFQHQPPEDPQDVDEDGKKKKDIDDDKATLFD